ncbi:hypothetical protein EL77_1667 [Escherichia coli]|nr:hypothetical protein EL77_1667 [Escherichia coli]
MQRQDLVQPAILKLVQVPVSVCLVHSRYTPGMTTSRWF